MRAIWKGSISFGLVNIPISLYSAIEQKELKFHYLHKDDLSPIRFAKICKREEKEVQFDEIVQGFEIEKGDYIVMDEEDFKKANVKESSSIQILSFANEKDIDTALFEKPYFLEPQKGAGKAYALLREALKKTKKVAIGKYVIRNKEHIAIVKAENNVLILEQMRFADEVRTPKGLELPESEETSEPEIQMAIQLIEQLSKPFHPEEYKDTYSEELKEIITEKSKGHVPQPRGEEPEAIQVGNLMEMLKRSLEKEKQSTK